MKKIILIIMIVMSLGCMINGESEFTHMPTQTKTLVYSDEDTLIYRITEFDGYTTTTYYIDNNDCVVELSYYYQ